MSWGIVASVGGSLVASAVSSSSASSAADAQTDASNAQIAESRRQFDQIQRLLEPYLNAGEGALAKQRDYLGLNGDNAQKTFIDNISKSPQMTELVKQGENAILQNASATGGLRGGNTQGALAQFRPQILNSLIDQQYGRLGGLTSLGQNAAAGVGNAGMTSSGQIINALGQQGAARAGSYLAQGNSMNGLVGGLANAAGLAFGNSGNNYGGQGTNVYGDFGVSGFGGGSGYGNLGSGFYGSF